MTFTFKRLFPVTVILAFALILVAFTAAGFLRVTPHAGADASTNPRMRAVPRTILWAWERPEHLTFINPSETGVAFLARTIYLRGDEVTARPRLQPLEVPEGTFLFAVVRVESDRHERPTLSADQLDKVVSVAAEAAKATGVDGIQIDFDAVASERDFYRRLLIELRPRLSPNMPLTITSLASWCLRDEWMDGLPVDEAVPMLFRMGVDEHRIKSFLADGGRFDHQLCKSSAGVSTDEKVKLPGSVGRVYFFNPRGWDENSARKLTEEHKR